MHACLGFFFFLFNCSKYFHGAHDFFPLLLKYHNPGADSFLALFHVIIHTAEAPGQGLGPR